MDRRNFLSSVSKGAVALAALPYTRVYGANERIRIGLIGAGDRGMLDLDSALSQPNIECVAVADTYSRRRDLAKARVPGVETYDDPMRLLERKDIDAVINATPLHLHSKYFTASLESGKDLYSEKTMTWNIPQAVACLKAAKASKQVIQIGVQHQSSGDLVDARNWIKQGSLGKIYMVESWMTRNTTRDHDMWVRPIPPDCDVDHVNWKLFLNSQNESNFDAYKYINWRLFWEFSGGNVTENMVHQNAWITSALGLELPLAASMVGGVFSSKDGREVPDTFNVSLEYPELLVVWNSTFSNSHYGLGERFLGSQGSIEHVSGATDMVTGKTTYSMVFNPEGANNLNAPRVSSQSPGVDDFIDVGRMHMANWFECIRTRNQVTNAPVEIGYRTAIAGHMANLAYLRKARVTLEEAMAAPGSDWL